MTTRTFGTTPAGTITKEQTLLSARRLPVSAGLHIVAGNLLEVDAATGLLIVAVAANVNTQCFVALADADNTSGVSAAITCPVAVRGHFVTVVADNAIEPGDKIKKSTNNNGKVMRFIPGTDDNNLAIGQYWGKEGGTISKSTTTPYLESYSDNADFPPVVCAQNDVIEVELQ